MNLFDISKQKNELKKLEEETLKEEFWKNENSTKVLGKIKSIKKICNTVKKLEDETQNLIELTQLMKEDFDGEIKTEILKNTKNLEKEVEKLEIKTMLSGKYDLNNAIITIHPGAGGTESQDWAEMLYRMYTRWANKSNYEIRRGIKMETFADYLLGEQDLINKMDILNRLQRLLKERKGITIFFNNTVIFKTEIARMFIDYAHLDVDRNLVLTACLLCNCKKIDGPQSLESLHNYAKNGAEFLATLGFDERFCKICEEVNRYSGSEPREPESDILELVDNFGGMLLDRPERAGYTPEKALIQLEESNLKEKNNRYLEEFKKFVYEIQEVEV